MTDLPRKLGEHIAQGVAQGIDDAHAASKDRRFAERIEWLEQMEELLAPAVRELGLLDHTDEALTPRVQQFLSAIGEPQHATDFLFLVISLIGLVWTGTSAAATGAADQLRRQGNRSDGFYVPDPMVTAASLARKYVNESSADGWFDDEGIKGLTRSLYKRLGYNHLTPDQALLLWRLKRVEEPEVDARLADAGLDDHEAAEFKSLRWTVPSAPWAAQAATQGQITKEQLSYLLEQNGIDPVWAEPIYETEGQTMPPDMAGRLFREGWITQAVYEQILIESNLKNKYVPLMANLRFRFPPMRQTLKMFSDGLIDAPTAEQYLQKLGYFPIDAENLVKSATKHGSTAIKNLSPSTIEKLYARNHYDRGTADAQLQLLGYDATEAGLLLDLVDDDKEHAKISTAVNAIGTRYTGWKISRIDASHALDALGVSTEDRDYALSAWDVTRSARTAHLTRPDLKKAFKTGALTEAQVEQHWRASGYDDEQVRVLKVIDLGET